MPEMYAIRFVPGVTTQMFRMDGVPDITHPGWTLVDHEHAHKLRTAKATIHPGSGPMFQVETEAEARRIHAQELAEQRAAATGRPERPGQVVAGSKLALDPSSQAAAAMGATVESLSVQLAQAQTQVADFAAIALGMQQLLAQHGITGAVLAPSASSPARAAEEVALPKASEDTAGPVRFGRSDGKEGAAPAAGKVAGAGEARANGGAKPAGRKQPGDKLGGEPEKDAIGLSITAGDGVSGT